MSFLILEVAPGNAVDVPGRQTGEMFSVLLLPWEPLVSKSILGEMNRNNRHNLESRPDVGTLRQAGEVQSHNQSSRNQISDALLFAAPYKIEDIIERLV